MEANAVKTSNKQPKRGIRLGCPLSPYLFLLVLTCVFHDVNHALNHDPNGVIGLNADNPLYADDKILFGHHHAIF
eukprot:3458193-Karenia_brevis.AAC.1